MVLPLLGMVSTVAGSAAGSAGFSATSVLGNAIGANDWMQNKFSPEVDGSKVGLKNANLATYMSGRYQLQDILLAPTYQDMIAIDNFFSSYGYTINRFTKPVLNVRENFTFVKTRDALVSCSSRQAADQMRALLNNGTKFWKGEIGNNTEPVNVGKWPWAIQDIDDDPNEGE